jgi:hypothetical protein
MYYYSCTLSFYFLPEFQIVSLRLGDHIPMTIMLHLLTNFVAAVEGELLSKFIGQGKQSKRTASKASDDQDSTDDDSSDEELTADKLLMEGCEISFKREELQRKKRRLSDAEIKLRTFTRKRKLTSQDNSTTQ